MMHHDGQVSFGKVQDFLVLAPPGVLNMVGEDVLDTWACRLVRCPWYKAANAGPDQFETIDDVMGLRLVKNSVANNDRGGDIWPLGNVAPVEVGLYPHWRKNANLMVSVSKRCTFVDRTRPLDIDAA
jgi:hypothetical protein